MCGLIYVKRKDGKPAYRAVLKRYRNQKHRGQRGFGYVAIENDEVVAYHRAPTEHEIVQKLEKEKATEILFHHRQPTSTPNIEESAHPLLVQSKGALDFKYLIAHNGVIRNTEELREKHNQLGFQYTTEIYRGFETPKGKRYEEEIDWNDSESVAIETALAVESKKGYIDSRGPAAVIGLQLQGKKVIQRFFYRNEGNPLKFHEDQTMLTITSIGQGDDVKSDHVKRILATGGFESIRQKDETLISTPFVYYQTPVTSRPTTSDKKEDDFGPYGSGYEDDLPPPRQPWHGPLGLPPKRGHITGPMHHAKSSLTPAETERVDAAVATIERAVEDAKKDRLRFGEIPRNLPTGPTGAPHTLHFEDAEDESEEASEVGPGVNTDCCRKCGYRSRNLGGPWQSMCNHSACDCHKTEQSSEIVVVPTQPTEEVKSLAGLIEQRAKGAFFITLMKDAVLWEEYDNVIGVEDMLGEQMVKFEEAFATLGGELEPEMMRHYESLQVKIKKTAEYKVALETEINKRGSTST